MASKDKATFNSELNTWVISYVDSKGDTKTRETIPPVGVMDENKAVDTLQGLAKDSGNLRRAAMSLLARILDAGGESLIAYKGAVSPKDGLPKELKTSMQDAEQAYFKQFLDAKHPHHKAFIGKLPKENERGEALEVGGKLNQERQFQYFLTALRQGSSYSNAKNVALSFWAYCGQGPRSQDGESMVPPEVMRVMVNEVRIIEPVDNSVKARLYAIRREIITESKAPSDQDLPEVVATLREILAACETLSNAAAMRATTKAKVGDVVQATRDAMAKANEKVPAGEGPGVAAVKEKATT